jgi:hypothetical protein
VSAPVDWLPLMGSPPLQPPLAVHELALVALQVSVALPPLAIVVGLRVSVTVGVGGEPATVTPTVWPVLPPGPAQFRLKLVVALRGPVETLPFSGSSPLQPPEAAHEVASLELHVSVAASPVGTLVGATDSTTVGAGSGATVTLTVAVASPPAPWQVRV